MILEHPGAHNFTVSLFLYFFFWLDTPFYRCQNDTFQFYNCKVVGPRVQGESKGGFYDIISGINVLDYPVS